VCSGALHLIQILLAVYTYCILTTSSLGKFKGDLLFCFVFCLFPLFQGPNVQMGKCSIVLVSL